MARSRRTRGRSQTPRQSTGSSNKYPVDMRDVKDNFPLTKYLDAVVLEPLEQIFVEKATNGKVTWKTHFRNIAMGNFQACVTRKEEYLDAVVLERLETDFVERATNRKVPWKSKINNSALTDLQDNGTEEDPHHDSHSSKKKTRSPSNGRNEWESGPRRSQRKSDQREKEPNYSVSELSPPESELDRRSTHSMTTRRAKKRGHMQISHLDTPVKVLDRQKKVVSSPTKKGQNGNHIPGVNESFADLGRRIVVRYSDGEEVPLTSEDLVLDLCEQQHILKFSEVIPGSALKDIKKIGEGTDGEVFLSRNEEGKELVLKFIPLDYGWEEDDEETVDMDRVREEAFSRVLPELMVCKAFNAMRESATNCTSNFIHMKRSQCIQGRYPEKLVLEWRKWKNLKGTQNWAPTSFHDDHIYVLMRLNNGGIDLESFNFSTVRQAVGVILQTAFSLAAAEAELKFEHRDLHWGNVLIRDTDQEDIAYIVDGNRFLVPTGGVFVSIIDFSRSRICRDDTLLYQDLSQDEDLFSGTGDSQFDVYRRMKKLNGNNWDKFQPQTNILWLDYLVKKIQKHKNFEDEQVPSHDAATSVLSDLSSLMCEYDSAQHLVESSDMQRLLNSGWHST